MTNNTPESDPDRVDEEGLEVQETRRRIVKLELETQKLLLEQRFLARQLSARGLALEWLKSSAVFVALIGAALTFYVGFGQLSQSERGRISDRFDRALTRVASEKPNERITGVSGLRLFLREPDESLQLPTLHFLVNAVSLETDPRVQSALLDVFADLKAARINEAALNEALRTAVQRNRSLTKSIRDEWRERITLDKKARMAKSSSIKLTVAQIKTPIPTELIAKLSLNEYLSFLDAECGTFDRLEPKVQVPLRGLAQLITSLLALGATGKDFSDIYCQECDFTTADDLSGATFDRSYLNGANFSRARLKKASFHNADLGGTNFFSADLSDANLRHNTVSHGFRDVEHSFPLLECANLSGADLSGTPLMVCNRIFSTVWAGEHASQVVAPLLLSAFIDASTKLENFVVVNVTEISDAYLVKHPGDALVSLLQNRRDRLPEDPLLLYTGGGEEHRRSQSEFGDEYSSTTLVQYSTIDATQLNRIRDERKFIIQGYLDQPTLTLIPLLAAFNDVIGRQGANHWLKKREPQPCGDAGTRSVRDLTINSGRKSDIQLLKGNRGEIE